MVVHRRRQSQVEEPLGIVSARERRQVGVESGERADVIIRALEVRIFTEKGSETLTLFIRDLKVTEQPFFYPATESICRFDQSHAKESHAAEDHTRPELF